MAYAWLKLWCDFLDHPRFRKRPDCDIRLVVGLMCHARKYSEDGTVRGLDAEEMRGQFGIKAPVQRVAEGLEHLLRTGWLELVDENGTYRIRDFAERQSKSDSSEAQKIRAKRYYQNHKDEVLKRRKFSRGLTSDHPLDSHVLTPSEHDAVSRSLTHGLTRQTGVSSHGDSDTDKDPRSDRSAVGGESEGRKSTGLESVDNPPAIPANVSESERSHFLKLWKDGKASEATTYLAQLRRPQVPETIQRKRGAS